MRGSAGNKRGVGWKWWRSGLLGFDSGEVMPAVEEGGGTGFIADCKV